MIPYKNVIACLLLLIPLASTELKTRKLPRDITLLTGKIMSFTGAGQHDLRDNIPGEPGVDYPIYSSPPETSFSCFNRHEGYYADVESRCQVFRICSNTDHSGKGFAFLCPNGTLFSQHDFVCDWYRNVGCDSSPNYYFMNELLDKAVSPHPELLMKDIVAMVNYPMKIMKQQKKFQNGFPQVTRLEPTTPRPIPIEIPTQPPYFTPAQQPATLPVRNPFERVTPRPQAQIFINSRPQITQPRIPELQIQTIRPQIPQSPAFPLPQVPQSQILEQPTQQPIPELFSPTTTTTPQPTPSPVTEDKDPAGTYDPAKVYISNLGELSTDPGSHFDPNTAVILPDKSQEQSPIFTQAGNQEHLLEGKLEPNPNEAHKNLLLNLENIASSVPGNINSQLALVRDQPLVEGSEVQVPGTLHVSLNYTQRINTALKNVLIPSAAQDQLAANPILSSDGKLVSQIFGQNPLQGSNGILKFAHNINSAFQLHNPILNGAVAENKDIFNSQNVGPSHDTGIFSTGRGFTFPSPATPYGPDGKSISQSFAYGPGQQSTQGVGFTKSSLAVSTPASVLHTETIYIPSINLKNQPNPSAKLVDVTATQGPNPFIDRNFITPKSLLSNDDLGQDRDQLVAAYQHYGSDLNELRRNKQKNDKTHEKHAEDLLIKEVRLSQYDLAQNEDRSAHNNRIDELTQTSTNEPVPSPEVIEIPSSTTAKTIFTNLRFGGDEASVTPYLGSDDTATSPSPLLTMTEPLPIVTERSTTQLSIAPTVEISSTYRPLLSTVKSINGLAPTDFIITSTGLPLQFSDKAYSTPASDLIAKASPRLEPGTTVISILSTATTPIPVTTTAFAEIGTTKRPRLSFRKYRSTTIKPRTISTKTLQTTPKISAKEAIKSRNRFHSRTRQTRLTLPKSITTPNTIESVDADVLPADSVTKRSTNLNGIQAALKKSNKKVIKVFKRRKLTFIEDSKHASNGTNLSKVRYTSTLVSSTVPSNSTTSPVSESSSSSTNNNNNTNNIENTTISSKQNSRRHLQSTTHIIHNQSSKPNESNGFKSQSAYVNIPGTKISIAKSIEEGFFSVSNYPLLPNNNKPMSFSSIFPGIIIHPGSPFALKERPKFNSNFFLPVSTAVTTTEPNDLEPATATTTTTTLSPPIIQDDNGIFASTAIPSLTSIPLTPHSAQRRSDAFSTDDDDEDSFFKGVSSYNVPISSVGRLPADILGTRRRRYNRGHH